MDELPYKVKRKLIERIEAGDLLVEITSDEEGRPVTVRAEFDGQECFPEIDGELLERIATVVVHQRARWGRSGTIPAFTVGIVCPTHGYSDTVRHPKESWRDVCKDCMKATEQDAAQVAEDAARPDLDAPAGDPHDESSKRDSDDIPF